MNIILKVGKDDCCLIIEGEMTCRFSREIENVIIESMRNHQFLRVDLSGVSEIDPCGIHLLGVLLSFGDEATRIVAASTVAQEALSRFQLAHKSRIRRSYALDMDSRHRSA